LSLDRSADILQMEASTSPNLSQLANFDKPMTTPGRFAHLRLRPGRNQAISVTTSTAV
jgi:hypothetical protein